MNGPAMTLFILSFLFFCLAALGMAVSVLFRGAELKGTCATLGGGVHAFMTCEICPARHEAGPDQPHSCARRKMARQS